MDDPNLRAVLETLDPTARDVLRRVLIHDQADRDAISSDLLRYRDGRGDDWADIIDMLTMHPEARRRIARLLAEIDASSRQETTQVVCRLQDKGGAAASVSAGLNHRRRRSNQQGRRSMSPPGG